MRNVMKNAWEIAREGQRKFGGKVSEYIAEALRMAWAIAKNLMEMVKLVGSEKQIKWAESIRKELITIFKSSKESFIDRANELGRWEKDQTKFEPVMDLLEKELFANNSAKFYIEEFGYAGSKEFVLREMATDICKNHKVSIMFARKIGM